MRKKRREHIGNLKKVLCGRAADGIGISLLRRCRFVLQEKRRNKAYNYLQKQICEPGFHLDFYRVISQLGIGLEIL